MRESFEHFVGKTTADKPSTSVVRSDRPAEFWLLVALVVLAPLPLASVYAWSWGLMGCIVGGLLAAWSVRVALARERPLVRLKSVWPVVALFAVPVIWAVLQALPVTPSSWHHPLWQSAAEVLGESLSSTVSLDPYETLSTLARLLTYSGIFWLSLQYCRRASRARQALLAIAYAGLAYAVYGMIVHFSGSHRILWLAKSAYIEDLTSTFVNRNSYAGYAGLALICATALIATLISPIAGAAVGWRERLQHVVEKLTGQGWSLLIAWVALFTALLQTHSRAGFVSTLVGLVGLLVALSLGRSIPWRSAALLGALCLAMLGVFFTAGGGTLEQRLAETSLAAEQRPRLYQLTIEATKDAPILGTGYGTFEEVFRFYRTSDLHGYFMRAHSTYLETVLELGAPAALCLFGVFAGFLILTFRGVRRRRRDAVYSAVGFAATLLAAAHSTVDFSLQIPAVTATYCLIMGAACAQSWSSRRPADSW